MSLFVLDTDTLSLLWRGHNVLSARILQYPPHEIVATVVSFEEQVQGWISYIRRAKSLQQEIDGYTRLRQTAENFGRIGILDYTLAADNRFDVLVRMKLNIGRHDLRIAAIALENQATIVTRNVRDFTRIPGLSVED